MEKGSLPVISISQIVSIIKDVLPERELHQVIDHGIWVRQNFELVFNDGSKAFMKIQIQDEWLDLTVNESRLSEILRYNGLPGPETLYLEPQGENLGLSFIIQSALKGRHLSDWLSGTSENQWPGCLKQWVKLIAKSTASRGILPVYGSTVQKKTLLSHRMIFIKTRRS